MNGLFGSTILIFMSLAFAKEELLSSYSFFLYTYYSKREPHVEREFVTFLSCQHKVFVQVWEREVRTEWKN